METMQQRYENKAKQNKNEVGGGPEYLRKFWRETARNTRNKQFSSRCPKKLQVQIAHDVFWTQGPVHSNNQIILLFSGGGGGVGALGVRGNGITQFVWS